MRGEKSKSSEEFLHRLSREYRRGWAHEKSRTVRDQTVLNVFMLGLAEESLAMSLQMEYSKPCYVGRPPSVNKLRAYVRILESSRKLRSMKSGEASGRNPAYALRKDAYVPRGETPADQQMRNQQANLQGYINPPAVNWNRQGAGNAVSREQAYALDLYYKCGVKNHIAKYCEDYHQQQQQQQVTVSAVAEVTQGMEQLHTEQCAPQRSPSGTPIAGILKSLRMEVTGHAPAPQVQDYHAPAQWADQQMIELPANSVQGN